MTRLILAIGCLALAGATTFPQPLDRWMLWIAGTAGLALVFIVISAALDWIGMSDAHFDARRRNGGWDR